MSGIFFPVCRVAASGHAASSSSSSSSSNWNFGAGAARERIRRRSHQTARSDNRTEDLSAKRHCIGCENSVPGGRRLETSCDKIRLTIVEWSWWVVILSLFVGRRVMTRFGESSKNSFGEGFWSFNIWDVFLILWDFLCTFYQQKPVRVGCFQCEAMMAAHAAMDYM